MSILQKLTTQQVVAVYNVFAKRNGSATVKKFRDAETGKKRLQDITRGLDRTVVMSALKQAKVPADVIKLLPTTPTVVAIPEVSAPVVEAPKPKPTQTAAEVLERERQKEKVKVTKEEKKASAKLRQEIRLTDGCAEVFRALRSVLKKKDDEIDTTALAKQMKTTPLAIIRSVEKLQKLNLVRIEDDSPDDTVKLWYISLTRDGLSAPVPKATNGAATPSTKPAKKALPSEHPGPSSRSNGKKVYKLVDSNPRREGTHGWKSFNLIKDGMSYEQYRTAGGRPNDLAWDVSHGYVELR